MALSLKSASARVACKRVAPARAAVRPLVVRASAQSDKVGGIGANAASLGPFDASTRVLGCWGRDDPAPPLCLPSRPPIGSPQAAVATVAAGASVLALAVPQAAQAAQEAFMVAEVNGQHLVGPAAPLQRDWKMTLR